MKHTRIQQCGTQNTVKVIVADDECHIRALISTLVRSLGYQVAGEAGNGAEVVDLVKKHHPDMVLLDINMPQMNGVETLRRLHSLDSNICVIMLTSVADIETIEDCIFYGASNFIRKDTPMEEIKELIAETWANFSESQLEAVQ